MTDVSKLDNEQLSNFAPLRKDCADELAKRVKFDILTATHLPNGAQILSRHLSYGVTWIVLCAWEKGSGREYVTWVVDASTGEAYWGHYFPLHELAERDYDHRISHV